jgi:hypothetical protein
LKSLGFSKFRSLMDTWDIYLLESENESIIRNLFEKHELIMFFKKENDYFGCDEDGRIVFAKMKNPDEEMPEGWEKEANFTAININKMIKGDLVEHVFDINSIKKLKVVSIDDVVEKFKNEATDSGNKINYINLNNPKKDRDQANNFTLTDED